MNKTELVSALAHKTGKTQKEAKAFLNAFTETVTATLKSGVKNVYIYINPLAPIVAASPDFFNREYSG